MSGLYKPNKPAVLSRAFYRSCLSSETFLQPDLKYVKEPSAFMLIPYSLRRSLVFCRHSR